MQRCFALGATSQENPTSSPQPQIQASSSSNGSIIIHGGSREIVETLTSNSSHEQTLISYSSNSSTTSTLNPLAHEYKLAVETKSFSEIWSKFHHNQNQNSDDHDVEDVEVEVISSVSQVLQPNRELVHEALLGAKPTNLTRLISDYFDHSEHTSRLCFLLHRSIDRARSLYSPLIELLQILPFDSILTQSQCDYAFEVFLQFDLIENPFPQPNSDNFHEMRLSFSQLKQQLDRRLYKARSQARLRSRFPTRVALCFVTLLTRPRLDLFSAKKQVHHIAQLDAASRGTYVLNNDLNTIDRLVTRLHGVVQSDKDLIRLGLGKGKYPYSIQEVVKLLNKNHTNVLNQLRDLEEHLCLYFTTVNRARSLLLHAIRLHR